MSKKTYGHYEAKAKCTKMIEKTIRSKPSGVKRTLIYYFTMTEFGFSEKMTDKIIDILINAGVIIEDEDEEVLKYVL